MNGDLFKLVELILIFGVVLGFAVWELVKLHRDEHSDDKPEDEREAS